MRHKKQLPRLTKSALVDLRWYMLVFGIVIGLIFPYALIVLGLDSQTVLKPQFFAATILAGLIVAFVNYNLAVLVVGSRVSELSLSMNHVEEALQEAAARGDWASCDPEECLVPVDSADELGDAAASFNRLVTSLAASNQLTSSVTQVSKSLASHLDLAELAEATVNELIFRTAASAAALLIVDNGRVTVAAAQGVSNVDGLAETEAVKTAIRTGQEQSIRMSAELKVSAALVDVAPKEVRLLPIQQGVVLQGVLVMGWLEDPSSESLALVHAILPSLAMATRNSVNHANLQRVAAIDPLTGSYNRRFGLRRLEEEFKRSARTNEPLGLLMLDLDHFKTVNDTYGHLVGDRVLQQVASAARSALREGDLLVRYGGEEFLALLPGAGRHDTLEAAERIRRSVADLAFADEGHKFTVTISVGGTAAPDSRADNPELLINLADEALYSAKSGGRDCTIMN